MPSHVQVVLGATGGVGQAVVQALAAQGAQVRAVNRSGRALVPASVEVMAADLTSRESTRAACQRASVVYHCAGVPYDQWATSLPVMLDNVIAALSATGATLVYIDNTYMYAPTSQPLTEDSLQAPISRKGQLRKQLAETILTAHARGQIRATIGRSTDFYGPGVRTSFVGEQFFNAVARQTRCAARALVRRGCRPRADHAGGARAGSGPGLAPAHGSGAHRAAVHCPGR
jgi:nucleoside-diphosphate-sugar epimerase